MDDTIELGGRPFRRVGDSTIEHDVWVMGHVHRAGLTVAARMLEGETADEFATRLTGDLMASGRGMLMLGGVLVPAHLDGLQWTPALGEETARYIGSLTAPDDKAKVLSLLAGVVADFFAVGLLSLRTSRSSSGRTSADEQPESSEATAA